MPQPAELDEIEEPLVSAYRNAWLRILDEQQRIAVDPLRLARQRRLREMQESIEGVLEELDASARAWIGQHLPQMYGLGGAAGVSDATGGAGEFVWTQIHQQAVQTLANDLFQDLLSATQHTKKTTKDLVRTIARSESLQKAIEGRSPLQAANEMARILKGHNIHSLIYKDGSKHGLAEYSKMAIRTKTATAYNLGTLNGAETHGVKYWQVFDGPECGWSFHDDPSLASGRLVTRDEATEFIISHPNCRRSFGARPDVKTKAEAKAEEGSLSTGDSPFSTFQEVALHQEPTMSGLPDIDDPDVGEIKVVDFMANKKNLAKKKARDFHYWEDGPERRSALWAFNTEGAVQLRPMVLDQLEGRSIQEVKITNEGFRLNLLEPQDPERSAWDLANSHESGWMEKRRADWGYTAENLDDDFRKTANWLAHGIEDAEPLDGPLFKGMFVQSLDEFQVGEKLDFRVSSFSTHIGEAKQYAVSHSGTPLQGTSVIVEIEPGARAFPLQTSGARYGGGHEHLFHGITEVTSVEEVEGRVIVHARVVEGVPHPVAVPAAETRVASTGHVDKLALRQARLEARAQKVGGAVESPAEIAGLRSRIDEVQNQTQDALARLKAASGGRVRAKVKAEIAQLEEERLQLLGRIEELEQRLPPVVPPKLVVNPDNIPTIEEILKDHFGWTRPVAQREQMRIRLERVPPVEQITKEHVGWTRAVAQKERDRLIQEVIKDYPGVNLPKDFEHLLPVKPVPPKPVVKPQPQPPAVKPSPGPAPGGSDRITGGLIQDRIARVQAKYAESFAAINVEQDIDASNMSRQLLVRAARLDPEMPKRFPDVYQWRKDAYGEWSFHAAEKILDTPEARKAITEAAGVLRARGHSGSALFDFERGEELFTTVGGIAHSKAEVHGWLKSFGEADPDGVRSMMGVSDARLVKHLKPGVRETVQQATDWYAEVVDQRVVQNWQFDNRGHRSLAYDVNAQSARRAYYQSSTVFIGGSRRTQITVHEIAHGMENHVGAGGAGSWQNQARAFLQARAKGTPASTIYKGTNEVGWKDEFISHYMGKQYPRDTEIISMGFELMYADPAKLLKGDPEYFWFMVGLLKGDL